MRLISWNCQGLGNPLTVQALRALVAREKPDILFLMETKNRNVVLNSLQKRLKFPNSFLEEPSGLAGGLAIFWQDSIHLTLEHQSLDLFDLLCFIRECGISMRLTCLRAPALVSLRLLFWDKLKLINTHNTLPWLCIGDFNEVMYHWEK